MEQLELLAQIFEICIIPLLGVLSAHFINWINIKIEEITKTQKNELEKKYLDMLNKTISDCVIATTQTYVDSLKKQNAFTLEAQEEAFKRTYDAVLTILSDEATEYLNEMMGDLHLYIAQKIEAQVNLNK